MNQLAAVSWNMALPLFNGMCIAVIYFALLWHNVNKLNQQYQPILWLGGGTLIRLIFLLLAFKWAITGKSALEILAVVAGFMLVRGIVLHRTRQNPIDTLKETKPGTRAEQTGK